MRNQAIIAGIGETSVGKLFDESVLGLHASAARAAVKDAGIEWELIDGLITSESIVETYPRFALTVAEYLGICEQLKYINTVKLGGAAPFAGLIEAWRLVDEGICNAVLVLAADKSRTGQSREKSVSAFYKMRHPEFEQPYGLSNVAAYAMLSQHYQHKYNATQEQFAAVSVTFREYAMHNEKAVYKDAMTIEDVLASRMIASPIHLFECSPITDGGAAIVVTKQRYSNNMPIRMEGFGMGFTHDHVVQIPDLERNGSYLSSRRAFDMAGLSTDDIDFAEIYDSYPITLLLALENVGFCEAGMAAQFVASGQLRKNGKLPTNTHGGLLSHSHSGGGAGGIFHITEAIKQLRGIAGINQLGDVHTAFIHGEGGILSANCSFILSNR